MQWGARSWQVAGLVFACPVLLALWMRHELNTGRPLVELRLLRHPEVRTAAATGVPAGMGMYLLLSLVTAFVQTPSVAGYGFDASVVVARLVLLAFLLMSVFGSASTARFTVTA